MCSLGLVCQAFNAATFGCCLFVGLSHAQLCVTSSCCKPSVCPLMKVSPDCRPLTILVYVLWDGFFYLRKKVQQTSTLVNSAFINFTNDPNFFRFIFIFTIIMTYFTYINIYLGTRIESYSEELPNVRQHFEWTWSFNLWCIEAKLSENLWT